MRYEVASPADDAEIRRLLRESPLEGEIRIGFEREPDNSLAGGIQGDLHQTVVARDEPGGSIAGMGSRSILECWVNGEPARLGYLSQLRVDARHRGRARALVGAYRRLRELHADGAAPFYLTTIIADNRPARRFLEAGLPGMPRYVPFDRLTTLALPVHPARAGDAGVAVERGSAGGIDTIVACLERSGRRHQFEPRWTRETLLCPRRSRGLGPGDFLVASRAGRVAGCLAVWDQREFKQTVVRGYGPRLRLLRPVLNLAAPLLATPPLPRAGTPLRGAFLSHVAVDGDDSGVLRALVAAALERASSLGLDYLVGGFSERDPLGRALGASFPCRRYSSIVYVVHWEDGAAAVARLDGRTPHPEAAIL